MQYNNVDVSDKMLSIKNTVSVTAWLEAGNNITTRKNSTGMVRPQGRGTVRPAKRTLRSRQTCVNLTGRKDLTVGRSHSRTVVKSLTRGK
ncbi:hypothetical protein J6590_017273 [Homalodisca vitripennis]|nr:hypothetical protein J6590_017273 [Homalodisca vitripennis]